MTTRVSPSFLRVGHFELFARRARRGDKTGLQQLEQLARHALFREYPAHADPGVPLQQQLLGMVAEAAERFAQMAADWLRVGYVQSNFNADNCLVAGRTVDYGPFGFIERYDPKWGMWIGSGEHFSFMNQPRAAGENFRMFAESLEPLLDEGGAAALRRLVDGYWGRARNAMERMWAAKMGLRGPGPEARALWSQLEALMRRHPTDYTRLWRQLAELPARSAAEDDPGLPLLEPAFREPLPDVLRREWARWLRRWHARLAEEGRSPADVAAAMKRASPKYIPRESMLVEAYTAAQKGDHSVVAALLALFRRPYDEQPYFGEKYYIRAPGAERQGGIGFMS